MEYVDRDVTVFASKIRRGADGMSLLKQRDLLLLVKTGTRIDSVTLVPVEHKDKTYHEVHLLVGSAEHAEPCVIITSKNEPQRWSSINKAIDTLGALIPELEKVIVQVRNDKQSK